MKKEDFRFLAAWLRDQSGLVLSEEKTYLVESRLVPVARRHGVAGLDDLVALVRSGNDAALNNEVVEAMTTNESFFFRDIHPFESLKDVVLPRLAAARKAAGAAKIRIWSAACSSGQEPYTIAMVLDQNPGLLQGLEVEIVGTDLSSDILAKARDGMYTQFEAQRGLPIQLLMRYFTQVGEHWQISEELRRRVRLEQANLLHDLSRFGRFDVVFCRNVLIYFDQPTKAGVLARIRARMPDDGYLFLGGAETVFGVTDDFATVPGERGVYCVSGAGAAAAAATAAGPAQVAAVKKSA